MTIKKRLLVSNILMIIIPIILSVLAALVLLLVFTGIINLNWNPSYYDSDLFWRIAGSTDKTFSVWSNNPDLQAIETDIDDFNSRYNTKNIYLSLYENNQLIYPSGSATTNQSGLFVQIVQDVGASHTGIIDQCAFYSKKINNYTAVMTCTQYMDLGSNYLKYKNTIIDFGALLFAVVMIFIGLTNYFLSKYIIKRIVGPLEILNYGVHQIQLGNLDYCIKYDGQDEFSTVCADFNLMAKQLHESVELRKKDEANRKELIAGISHDLRTPLTSIKAYVEGLIDGIATNPQVQKSYLETIKAKAENIDQIVDKLSMFSKLDMGEFPFYPEKLNIGEEIAAFVKANSEEYQNNGLAIRLTNNTKDVKINIDPVQFSNVLTNVLENSVKYKNKEFGMMEIACSEQGDDICLTLTDDGPGVPEESIEKLFDVFFRNDPSRSNPSKGSGLGLAITAKVIERSGGHVRAENVPEGGLRIVISMPKAERGA